MRREFRPDGVPEVIYFRILKDACIRVDKVTARIAEMNERFWLTVFDLFEVLDLKKIMSRNSTLKQNKEKVSSHEAILELNF